MAKPVEITTHVEDALDRLTRQFRNKPNIEGILATLAATRVTVIDVADATVYEITINGTPVAITSGTPATDVQIAASLVAAINALSGTLDVFAIHISTEPYFIILPVPDAASTDYTITATANIAARRTAFVDQIQELEYKLYDFLNIRGILDDGSGNTATGAQLDGIGEILNEARIPGEIDDDYRSRLLVKITRNLSKGEPERLISVLLALTNSTIVQIEEYFPGAAILTFDGTVSNPSQLSTIMESVAVAGVRLSLVNAPDFATAFAFAGGTGLGFDDGEFASVI